MQSQHAWKPDDEMLRVGVAASLLGVSADTLKRWEKAGRISSVRTPTGHRRFRRTEVSALLTDDHTESAAS